MTQKDFITSEDYPEKDRVGYNIYAFDIRHHLDFSPAQLMKERFVLRPAAPRATVFFEHALLLGNKI